ncbi:MAG TPA: histidine kinase dimerization/phospho-acceptor domain-containing protein [Kofleriaceae bacterium]|jgi:signal transduction histidine kinase
MASATDRDWAPLLQRMRSSRSVALIVSASFAAVGIVWVLATDVLLYTATDDAILLARIETAVDWGFVVLASVLLYLVTSRAAAKLSRARAALSTVVETICDGLLVVGNDRTIIYANPSACHMLSVASPDELFGMTAEQFSRRYIVSRLDGSLVKPDEFASQRAFRHPGPLHYKARVHPSQELELIIAVTATAVRGQLHRRAAFVVSVLHDITDTERLEQLRDGFFSAAAHALKTPVAIIKANVQFVERTAPLPLQPSLAAIDRQCDRIDRIVQNLQVVSRARSRSLELVLVPTDLEQLVRDTVRDLSAAAGSRVRMQIVASPRVLGDRERLATAVRNLVHEALRNAAPSSPVTLRLTQEGYEAELAVIYEALPVAERTFTGAEQYDDTTLSRCATETIAEAHGGNVGETSGESVESIWMRLPTTGEKTA